MLQDPSLPQILILYKFLIFQEYMCYCQQRLQDPSGYSFPNTNSTLLSYRTLHMPSVSHKCKHIPSVPPFFPLHILPLPFSGRGEGEGLVSYQLPSLVILPVLAPEYLLKMVDTQLQTKVLFLHLTKLL